MAAHGRAHSQQYAWDRVSQRVLSYYERLIHERRMIDREAAAASRDGTDAPERSAIEV
jgi:hypothetical protein